MKCLLFLLFMCFLSTTSALAQSVPAHSNPGITVYEHINFGGAFKTITSDWDVNASKEWNDRISSIRVPEGYKIQIFENIYSGASLILSADWSATENSPEAFNDIISSIRIIAYPDVTGITVYEHTDFAGNSKTINKDWDLSLLKEWNKKISSIRVPAGYRIQVFENAFSGQSRILSGNWSAANGSAAAFNDVISSIKILSRPTSKVIVSPATSPSVVVEQTITSPNIAIGKNVSSSSRSQWSSSNDPRGAIDGIKNGSYGFHTSLEENPWLQIDLGAVMYLEKVVLFNRQDINSERSRFVQVIVSTDGLIFETVYDRNGIPFGGIKDGKPLSVFLNNILARFVRFQLNDENYFHLDEVEIYGTPFVSATLEKVAEVAPVVTQTTDNFLAPLPPVVLPNIPDEPLYIISKTNGKYIEQSTNEGQKVLKIATANGTESQQWEVKPATDGYVNIISVFNGNYLHHDFPQPNLLSWEGLGESNQEWNIEPAGGGYFTITSRITGKAIYQDVQKSALMLGIKNGTTNQLFKFVPTEKITQPVITPVVQPAEIIEVIEVAQEPEKTDYVVKSLRSSYSTRETIVVEYSGFTGQSGEWINVIAKGKADNEWGNFQYTKGTEGELIFEWLNLSPGEYEIRAYQGGMDYTVKGRFSFRVD